MPRGLLADLYEQELVRKLGRRSHVPYRLPESQTPVMDQEVKAGLERLKQAGRRSGLKPNDRLFNASLLQDVLAGAGQVASAPVTGLLQPVLGPALQGMAAVADRVPLPSNLLTYKKPGDKIDTVGSAARQTFSKAVGLVDSASDAIGYPREYGREAALAGAGLLAPSVARGVGRVADAAEGLINKAGRSFKRPGNVMMSGGGPVKLADDGIIAYHGSPHSFDKFSMDKIGTGEGAQAYGHGLYFAESPAIAKSYRDALSSEQTPVNMNGVRFEDGGSGNWYTSEDGYVPNLYDFAGPEAVLAARAIKDRSASLGWKEKIRQWADSPEQALAAMKLLRSKELTYAEPGSMYQVRLNVKPDELLDWDKPMTGQPDIVQKALAARHLTRSGIIDDRPLGEVLDMPARYKDGSDIMLTDDLKKAGVKGIRYLDAGSRDGRGGTYNYVIFDDSLIDILKKYGIPMTAGAGGAMMVAGEAMPPELATQMGGGA